MKLLVNKLFGKFAIIALIIFTSMSIASAKKKLRLYQPFLFWVIWFKI